MKKRLLSMLLVLAMLASLWVLPADAAEYTTSPSDTCPCGCGEALDSVNWQPWDVNKTGDPAAGHYYLDGDYVQSAQHQIMAGDHVVLDLRGHTITTKSYSRLLLVYGQMHILDTVGGGRFMAKTSGGAFGGVVMVSTNEVNDSLFALHSGTITRDADNKGSRRGGLIHVSQSAVFRMTGGMLLGGSTVTPDGTYLEPGGCVAGVSAECTIEILGGQIIGGESATYGGNIYNIGTTTLKNCEIIGGVAASSGGNIYQTGGTLTIENCVISDGVANDTATGGGNIALAGNAAMRLTGSTVRNGYSNYHGGNIYIGTASAVVEASQITAGVARVRGNNLYGSTAATGLTITNCALPGDISYVGSGLVLSGNVKIGLLNHGLRLNYGSDYAAPLDANNLTDGSEIYVVAKHTFTTSGANADYFKGAIRTVVSSSDQGLVATYAANGELGGYCPHCGQTVAWKSFSTTNSLVEECLFDSSTDTDPACTGRHIASGHYYMGASVSSFAQHYAGNSLNPEGAEDVVIDMAGYSITATHRAFYVRPCKDSTALSSLTVLDSYGGSKLTGSGANNQPGGLIYNESSHLTIYDGNFTYKPVSGRNVTGGGLILNGNSFTMHGGILDGSAFTYTDASTTEKTYTYHGGALYQYSGSKYDFTMTAGRMIGGTTQSGGCAYFGYNNQVSITGGQFVGGVAQSAAGGAIRTYGTSSYAAANIQISGVSIRGGTVESDAAGGGNLSISYCTATIADSYIEGGTSAAYAGNIMVGSTGNITFKNCIIEGGTAVKQGGNVHISSTSTTSLWEDCQFINGSAAYGGNVNSGNGYNTFKGGQLLYGTASTSYGGNLAASAGNNSATSKNHTTLLANESGNGPLLAGGNAKSNGGNLYVGGVLDLQAATLAGGHAASNGQDLYVAKGSKQSKLTVGGGVTGEIRVAFSSALLGEAVYGQVIDRTACETLNATMVMEGNYNNALLCAKDGALYVGAIAVIDANDSYTWFTDTASAVAACNADSYVKLFIAQDVVLTKDCAIDLCGQTVNISGNYTLYGMDSSGDDYTTPTGKAVLSAETTLSGDTTMGGKRYIAVSDDNGAAFHRLENRICSVSLRPCADGIYFTGSFGCDDILVQNIVSYGVAVSTVNMPGTDFASDSDTLYTVFDPSTLVGGARQNGVLISGIMKQQRNADLNAAYGKMPVFATSYLQLADGTVILSDDPNSHSDDVALSLYDVMNTVDTRISQDPLNYRILTNPMRDFYSKWEASGMDSWSFQNIIPPKEDNVLNILMIGNSGCYYYVEELSGLLAAAGIKANVCNVYYNGCKLYQHWNWWKDKESRYQFFVTNENGRVMAGDSVSLEWCLQQQNWDVISLQEGGLAALRSVTAEEALQEREVYLTDLYGYLREQFPAARLLWNQSSAYQVGYDRTFAITSIEDQRSDTLVHRNFAIAVCERYGIDRIPKGDAFQMVRENGYDNLCARLGKGTDHEGDYYHDGDWGGGQFLTACVWYEMLTGLSCLDNPYRPVYTYGGEVVELDKNITFEALQAAAHQAVADYLAESKG